MNQWPSYEQEFWLDFLRGLVSGLAAGLIVYFLPPPPHRTAGAGSAPSLALTAVAGVSTALIIQAISRAVIGQR
jgi:hypothetical protein